MIGFEVVSLPMHDATMALVASSLVSASSNNGFQSVSAMCSSCEREQWKMDFQFHSCLYISH